MSKEDKPKSVADIAKALNPPKATFNPKVAAKKDISDFKMRRDIEHIQDDIERMNLRMNELEDMLERVLLLVVKQNGK